MEHNNQEEIIRRLSELVDQLRAGSENTMSSDAGLFQAPPPLGDTPEKNDVSRNLPPHVARVIRLRLRSIKEKPSAA